MSDSSLPPPPASGPLAGRSGRHGIDRRFATMRSVLALMLREMATRYGQSPGGYLWALLEPLGAIAIMSIGFSLIVRSPPLGSDFVLFFATGFLPFSLYMNVSNNVSRSINFSRALLFYPAVTWADAVLARFLLNTLTEMLVTLILLTAIIGLTGARVLLEIWPILSAVGMAALLGLAVGVLNCALYGLFPVWMQIWSIVTRPLFLISGIFYLYEDLPAKVQNILWYNPLVHIVGDMRAGFYPSYQATYVNPAFVIGFALICLFLGVVLMGRYHRKILNDR